ncbi:MAG: tetratricopeptide repeat protein, partial [Candidatus Omnitrophica bacterium]|nr:tetratricopeptide repeat protein [Candidatus Omnitrophota bacterium]
DDHYVISQNIVVKKPTLEALATSGFFDAANRNVDSHLFYYRPVVLASLAMDYRLWGNNPVAFRWVNVGIHIANSLLIAALLYLLFLNADLAMAGAFLFSVLPVHEWSVRYIAGRGDLLSAFYGLLSLVLLARFVKKDLGVFWWTSLACFCLAVLSKESALLNVALAGLVAWMVTKDIRRSLQTVSVFLLAAASYYVLRQIHAPMGVMDGFHIQDILNGVLLSYEYSQRFLMPWAIHAWSISGWVGTLLQVGIAVWVIITIRRSADKHKTDAILFGVIWMVICSLSFVFTQRIIGRLGPGLSEHFLYLEAVGFVWVLVLLIDRMARPMIRMITFAVLLLFFILTSLVSARFWQSEEVLLRHVHQLEGRNKGVAYEQLLMRYDLNAAAVSNMIGNAPSGDTQSLWYRRLGDIYRHQGNYLQAMDALARAVDLNPRNIEAINELAVCHLENGTVAEGVKLLQGSILISTKQSDAFRLLGVLSYRLGRFEQSVSFLQRAWDHDPDQSEAALHLMMAYYFLNNHKAYVQTVEKISDQYQNSKMILSFAAHEFYSHG